MKNKKVTIQITSDRGKGVFARAFIKKGEIVVNGRAVRKVANRTNHSFQIGFDSHVQLDIISRSINHSCEPNTGVRNNMFGSYNFIAIRDIRKGEEITWDYETTEYISISVKDCLCGSNICRKELKDSNICPSLLF